MALVFSVNNGLHHKPLSLSSPNFNSRQFSTNLKHKPLFCSSFTTMNRRCRRLFPMVNRLDKDSAQSNSTDEDVNNLGVKAALSILRFYKSEISPLLPNSCRYVPTCSEYSMIAYRKYGVLKGTILTGWRLCRCNPLGGSGFDPPRWFDEPDPPKQ
ncbi:unnamed protein product [Ilex paraguariensis]|uniref:Uncharacterized protein n=1 Tax=Ilex paraguariensis TaxID=185542 RepID=A0ABC8UW57_9AQUA